MSSQVVSCCVYDKLKKIQHAHSIIPSMFDLSGCLSPSTKELHALGNAIPFPYKQLKECPMNQVNYEIF